MSGTLPVRPPAGGGTFTPADQDRAAGRDPADVTADERMTTAVRNTERVAARYGSRRWVWGGPR